MTQRRINQVEAWTMTGHLGFLFATEDLKNGYDIHWFWRLRYGT